MVPPSQPAKMMWPPFLLLLLFSLDLTSAQTPAALSVSQVEVNQRRSVFILDRVSGSGEKKIFARSRYILSARLNSGSSNCGSGNTVTSWTIDLEEDWERNSADGSAASQQSKTSI